jgi:hypothetical protein
MATASKTKSTPPTPVLTMKYAGGFVQHLGLSMYGGAVPAIAELIANAWDADATRVDIEIPFEQAWDETSTVVVRDNGIGMTAAEVDERYLVLGLDRRDYEKRDTTPGRRRGVLGRKGIGKLAGFGIARVIDVETVKAGELTRFEMDYDAMTGGRDIGRAYQPKVIDYRTGVRRKDGTTVVLSHIKLARALGEQQFRQRMAERFALLGDNFEVFINSKKLEPEEHQFQFRFPADGWESESVAGAGEVRWWIGFTKTPLGGEEAKGVRVLARGKLVQEPFFFDRSGGTTGQFGMQYMSGAVQADFLDGEADLIATDRATVLWEDPRAAALAEWGREKVTWAPREWASRRYKAKEARVREHTPYFDRIERLAPRQRAEVRKLVGPVLDMDTLTEERAAEIIELIVRAFENDSFMDLIRAINAADPESQAELADLLREWTIQEAVQTAQIVRGRVEVIRRFEEMIAAKVKEKPDMQDFVKANPWLLDARWEMLQHERSLDKVVAEHFPSAAATGGDGDDRLDFFCLADSLRCVVVELKRPGHTVGKDEIQQLTEYVFFLRKRGETATEPGEQLAVEGLLVAGKIRPDDQPWVEQARNGSIWVVTWRDLLQRTERAHREFLEVVKKRAPIDEPRIEALGDPLPARELKTPETPPDSTV